MAVIQQPEATPSSRLPELPQLPRTVGSSVQKTACPLWRLYIWGTHFRDSDNNRTRSRSRLKLSDNSYGRRSVADQGIQSRSTVVSEGAPLGLWGRLDGAEQARIGKVILIHTVPSSKDGETRDAYPEGSHSTWFITAAVAHIEVCFFLQSSQITHHQVSWSDGSSIHLPSARQDVDPYHYSLL